jgi:inorganic pyrophosphatase
MKVFIENEAGSDQKNIYNEKTLEYQKTYTVSRAYPYPYGFIPETTSGDGDNLDCFVITERKLKSGVTIECEIVGLMEQIEDGKDDHKILARLPGEHAVVDDNMQGILQEFVTHVFDHLPGKVVKVGRFLGPDEAAKHLKKCVDQ